MYSIEHKNYLKKLKKEKLIISLFRISIIIVFLITWELLSKYNIINSFLFSSPVKVFKTITTIELFKHIKVTLYEVLLSFILSTCLGILIAIIMWLSKIFSKIIDPYITVLNSLPKVALGPLFIIWVGASFKSVIVMAITISLFTTIINIYNGFISVNNSYILLLKSFKANRFQIFKKVILPSNILNIISTLKINISLSLTGLLPPVGEKIFFNKCYSRY